MFISRLFKTEAQKKPLFCNLFSAVAKWFSYMSPRLPKSNCLHMYWTCSRAESLLELPSPLGFMETSLIRNEVFSDLLCLICFICNKWALRLCVFFLCLLFCNCPHEEVFFLFFVTSLFKTPLLFICGKFSWPKPLFSFLFPIIPSIFFFFFNFCLAHLHLQTLDFTSDFNSRKTSTVQQVPPEPPIC